MNSLLLFNSICGLLMFLTIYKQRKCWYFIWQLNGWRGLIQQPILWLLLIIYLDPKSIMSSIQRCHKYFQFPLAIIVFNRILLYVDDPETMESILTAPECLNKTFLQNGFYANKGLLHAKDEQWKMRRKQLNPAFSHNTLVSFFELFNRIANELKLKMSKDLQGYKVKFKSFEDIITRAVLEVSCLTTMGFETNFLEKDEKCIAKAYRFLMELTAWRVLKPWYQIDFVFRWLDNENYEKSKRANKLVKEFVANIVQQKHIEWQHKDSSAHQKPDLITTTSSDCATATYKVKDEIPMNEHRENHNLTGNKGAAANDALKNIIEHISSLPDTNANAFIQQQQHQQQQQQQQRIFIDQIFYLAQTGKLTLEDIMNEAQSMVVVSFETVSSCIINALLCLAINHNCQTKLRHEIKQMSSSKKQNFNKNKMKTTTATAITSIKHNENTNSNETCANRIDDDLDLDLDVIADCRDDMNEFKKRKTVDDDSRDAVTDENVNVNDCDVKVTMEHLLNMPYLDMIINESLRLLTTVPINLRNVSSDFQLNVKQRDKCICPPMKNNKYRKSVINSCCCSCSSRCVVVPKDTMIALDIFNMQRNDMYWGENALKFHPEHFAKKHHQQQQQQKEGGGGGGEGGENEVQKIHETSISSTSAAAASARHSYAFIPFSKGLRTCIGYRYSIYLTKIVLIKLISSFEFSTNIQLQDLQFYDGVSLKYRNAEKIHFEIKPVE